MKKSKLLMPLMGLTVLASVAPAMTLTSCNKNDKILISSATVGNMYDQTKMLVTNRIGHESLYDAATGELKSNLDVKFALQLSSISSKMRTIRVSIEKQGTDTTTPFNVALNGFTYDVEAYTSVVTLDTAAAGINPIAINSTVIEQLAAEKKEATLKFVVKFEEITDAGKAINSQEIWFSLVACPAKHDLPTITPIEDDSFKGVSTQSGSEVTFTGLKFENYEGKPNFIPEFGPNKYIWMDEHEGGSSRQLHINANAGDFVTVDNDKNITLYGACDASFKATESQVNFDEWYDINVSIVCKQDDGQEEDFVLTQWQCTATVKHKYAEKDWMLDITK